MKRYLRADDCRNDLLQVGDIIYNSQDGHVRVDAIYPIEGDGVVNANTLIVRTSTGRYFPRRPDMLACRSYQEVDV